nr:transglycosylase domain-containing protein [Lentibacillus saliphilus]
MDLWHTGKLQRSFRITYDVTWNVILFFLIIGFIGTFFIGGVGVGYFASLVKDEPIRDEASMEQAIYNYEETSKLYFADDIYFGDVQSDLHREEVMLGDVSPVLIDAVIATEDEYFWTHNGIVPKAIVRAMVQEVTNASTKSGGSTLTQQLIKNQILTNEVSFERKAKEILLAMRLENFFDKDEILEAYLNIVPYGREASGRNIAGIQTAAQGIFGVDAKDVTLPQAAFLAGLPQSPYAYTPFQNHGGLKSEEGLQPGINRMKSVLKRMYEEAYITEKEYKDALAHDITADFTDRKTSPLEKYPYLTFELQNRAEGIIKDILAKEDGITKEELNEDAELSEKYNILAKRALRMDGYNIHSTIDKDVYDALQKVAKNFEHYGPNWKGNITFPNGDVLNNVDQRVETGAYMVENSTGRTIAFVGGRGYTQENQINYATNAPRSNGSTMKPFVYGAAMEKGLTQPGSPILDAPFKMGDWEPNNVNERFNGLVSARHALTQSINVATIRLFSQFANDNIVNQYLRPMGITTLGDNEYANLALSIGAAGRGITVEENTNAFATFGNNGTFVDAYMIDKITTQDGTVVYEHEPVKNTVFSPQTNYLAVDMMRDVMSQGTGVYAKSYLNHSNVDWFGKTGTSQKRGDLWFVGGNPNITVGSWMGYKYQQDLECSGCSLRYYQKNGLLWASLINAAADVRPDLVLPEKRFQRPEGLVQRSVCAVSGMLPSELCRKVGLVRSDLFNAKYAPKKVDDSLIQGSYVMVDGQAVIANPNTPKEFVEGDGVMFNPEFLKRKGYDKLDDLTELYSRINPEAWKKIGIPNTHVSDTLKNDGKAPTAPGGVKKSGSKLVWKKSAGKNVIGYRIYRANQQGDPFKVIGHTTDTSYRVGNGNGIYHIKAVNYFGLESAASNEISVGDVTDKPEDQPDEDNDDSNDDSDEDNSNGDQDEDNGEDGSNNQGEDNTNNGEPDQENNTTEQTP